MSIQEQKITQEAIAANGVQSQADKLTGTAAQAIAYKEFLGYLEGRETLEDCIELLKRRSRNYAKRQLTWLKRDDSIHWIYYNKSEEFADVLQHSTEYLQKHGVQW